MDDTASPGTAEEPTVTGKLLGCRETWASEGVFAVQLLFSGEGTPVFCMEGGGVLYAECGVVDGSAVGRAEESMRAFTVRGLSVHRRYVFLVATVDGWVTVTYEGGEFRGFCRITGPPPL